MNSQIKITGDFDKVWFTADHHFGHGNIIEYCNRPFETVEEMDIELIDNWNTVVKPGDTVYHLGDFCLGNEKMAYIYFSQLNGQIKVLYNPWHHDGRWIRGDLAPLSKDGIGASALAPLVSIKIKQPKRESVYIMLCHYPLASWDRSHYGSLHLHGHCHGRLLDNPQFRVDVGVDMHRFYPISLYEILEMTNYYAERKHNESNIE